MKRKLNYSLVVMLVLLLGCAQKKETAQHEEYTCPMHPAVVADAPGTCPVCGMDLVRKVQAGAAVDITEDLSRLTRSANETVVSSIRTIRGEYRSMPVSIEAKGTVTYDTRYVRSISSRTGGRLEKVYLKYNYQPVRKGQKVAEVYSPELVTAQREWLYLSTHDADSELIALAKSKLLLLGLSEKQLQQILKRNDVFYTVPVLSAADGYLVPADSETSSFTTPAAASSGGGGMDGMGALKTPASTSGTAVPQAGTGTVLREGDYVSAGEILFRLASASALRVELELPAVQAASVHKGTAVKLDFENGHTAQATVDLVQPFFSEGEAFVTIRVYTRNTGDLHVGHFVQATFTAEPHETLWLPREAVLDLGLDRIVFLKVNGSFSARKVVTGMRTKDWVEIRQGLASSDEVADHAHYLVDSESFIKPAN